MESEDGYLVATFPQERSWEITAALLVHDELTLEGYFLEVTSGDGAAAVEMSK